MCEGQVIWIEMVLFSSSSNDSHEDLPPLADILKQPDAAQQEKENQDKIFQEKFEQERRLKDLEKKEEEANLRKMDEEKKKSQEDRKQNVQDLDTRRRKLEEASSQDYIRKIFNKNAGYLEDICSGRRASKKHEAFVNDKNSSRQDLLCHNYVHMLSKQKIDWIIEEIEKKWNRTSNEERDYAIKVIVPHLIIHLYSDFHNIPLEEAQQKIEDTLDEETAAEISGFSFSPVR